MSAGERRRVLASLEGMGFRADPRRGQNFLFDPQLLEGFLADAGTTSGERVLEVGPGPGTLTRRLLAHDCQVVAIELDERLCAFLRVDLAGEPALTLLCGDALANKNRLSPELLGVLGDQPFRLIANLPYAIATPLVQMLLQPPLDWRGGGVLVQLELAQRWLAGPGTRAYGAISVLLGLLGKGRITRRVPRHIFSPPPRVDSAFVVWERGNCAWETAAPAWRAARRLFTQRRKMLRSTLSGWISPDDDWWSQAAVDPLARPEQLTPGQFQVLGVEWERRMARSQAI